jgi:hypothetical protein
VNTLAVSTLATGLVLRGQVRAQRRERRVRGFELGVRRRAPLQHRAMLSDATTGLPSPRPSNVDVPT